MRGKMVVGRQMGPRGRAEKKILRKTEDIKHEEQRKEKVKLKED